MKISNQITNRDSQSIEKYLQEISKVPLLKAEEEVSLAIRIHKGDHEALEDLTKANLRFVVSVAKQYQNQGLPLSDLINEGNLGLIKAAQKFDETKGFKFISYAVWWIRQSILQALVEQSRIVRLPLNKIGSMYKISKAMSDFEQEFQREPSEEELAEILNLTKTEVAALINSNSRHVSMDEPMKTDEESGTLLDVIKDIDASNTEKNIMTESLKKEITRVLSVLPPRDSEIISYYYGLRGETGLTLEEIGKIYDLTRERVRQIKERSLRRLRKASNSQTLKWYLG